MYGIIEPEENFPDITNDNCALKECLTKEIYSQLFWSKTHSGYTIDQAIQIGIDCEDEEIGFFLGDYESIEVFEPLLGKLLDKIQTHFDYFDTSISHSGNLKMIKFDGTQTLKDFVIEYAFHLRRNLRGYSLPPHCTRAERREINRILIYILKQLNFDASLPHFHAYQNKIKQNNRSQKSTPIPKDDKKKKKNKSKKQNNNENRFSISITRNEDENKEYIIQKQQTNQNNNDIQKPKLKQSKSDSKKKKKKGKKGKKRKRSTQINTEETIINTETPAVNGHINDDTKDTTTPNHNDDNMDNKDENNEPNKVENNEPNKVEIDNENVTNDNQKDDNKDENITNDNMDTKDETKDENKPEIQTENVTNDEQKQDATQDKDNTEQTPDAMDQKQDIITETKTTKNNNLDEPKPKLTQSKSEPKTSKRRDSDALKNKQKQNRRDSVKGGSSSLKRRHSSNSMKKRRDSNSMKQRRDSNAMKTKKRRDSNSMKKRDSNSLKKRRDSNSMKQRRNSNSMKKRRDSNSMKKRDRESKKDKKKKKKKKQKDANFNPTSTTKLSKIKAEEDIKIKLETPNKHTHIIQASTDTVVLSPDDTYCDTYHTGDISPNYNSIIDSFDASQITDLVNIDDLTLTELEENGLAPSRDLSLSSQYLIGGLSRDFPDARTLFYNREAMVGAWTNHSNHLEMIIQFDKPDLNDIYKKFVDIYIQLRRILKRKEMAWIRHRRLGIITTNPKHFGTGLTIQCSIRAPYLCVHSKFKRILNKRSLELINVNDEDGVVDMETNGTLGRSEWQITMDLGNALIDLWRMEKALARNKDIEKLI